MKWQSPASKYTMADSPCPLHSTAPTTPLPHYSTTPTTHLLPTIIAGDRYPTVGLTLGGFTYNVNVTTYANVSADVRDIIVSCWGVGTTGMKAGLTWKQGWEKLGCHKGPPPDAVHMQA